MSCITIITKGKFLGYLSPKLTENDSQCIFVISLRIEIVVHYTFVAISVFDHVHV